MNLAILILMSLIVMPACKQRSTDNSSLEAEKKSEKREVIPPLGAYPVPGMKCFLNLEKEQVEFFEVISIKLWINPRPKKVLYTLRLKNSRR